MPNNTPPTPAYEFFNDSLGSSTLSDTSLGGTFILGSGSDNHYVRSDADDNHPIQSDVDSEQYGSKKEVSGFFSQVSSICTSAEDLRKVNQVKPLARTRKRKLHSNISSLPESTPCLLQCTGLSETQNDADSGGSVVSVDVPTTEELSRLARDKRRRKLSAQKKFLYDSSSFNGVAVVSVDSGAGSLQRNICEASEHACIDDQDHIQCTGTQESCAVLDPYIDVQSQVLHDSPAEYWDASLFDSTASFIRCGVDGKITPKELSRQARDKRRKKLETRKKIQSGLSSSGMKNAPAVELLTGLVQCSIHSESENTLKTGVDHVLEEKRCCSKPPHILAAEKELLRVSRNRKRREIYAQKKKARLESVQCHDILADICVAWHNVDIASRSNGHEVGLPMIDASEVSGVQLDARTVHAVPESEVSFQRDMGGLNSLPVTGHPDVNHGRGLQQDQDVVQASTPSQFLLQRCSQQGDADSVNAGANDNETGGLDDLLDDSEDKEDDQCYKSWLIPEVPDCQFCGAKRFYREPPGFCCANGQVKVEPPVIPLDLWELFIGYSEIALEFRRRLRTYNNTFAFTSLAMKYDPNYCWSNAGVYTLKVLGQVYHFMADLLPAEGVGCNVQLYFYGNEEEFAHRMNANKELKAHIVRFLMALLKENPYCMFFKSLRSRSDIQNCNIVIRCDPNLDRRIYNLPTVDQVAAIWNEAAEPSKEMPRDIKVNLNSGESRSINYFYGCYDCLQYPVLFPKGESGWHFGIKKQMKRRFVGKRKRDQPCGVFNQIDVQSMSNGDALLQAEEQVLMDNRDAIGDVSCREYYCYLFQIRGKDTPSILRTGRLGQQYEIDMYIKIESARLDYLRRSQQQCCARMESLQGIVDSVDLHGETDAAKIGKRIVLPASFIGGPRDMRKRYLNAMSLVQKYGKPDFFITMTCNPSWPEIQEGLLRVKEGSKRFEEAQNRSDLVARVFRARLEELKDNLVNKKIFGRVAAYIYVVEYQKRGLPHAHFLLIMENDSKMTSSDLYDKYVCAELPDAVEQEYLHSLVVDHMMHGPCGTLNSKNVCMRDGQCKNHYPTEYCNQTLHRENGYPLYKRRDNGFRVLVRNQWLDNRWVVPYNPYLLEKFDCHINVEICADIKLVKYLYKYVYKGHDRVCYHIAENDSSKMVDEISNFQSGRWICAPEAMWRIYGFSLGEMHPPVIPLQVHLPNQHYVTFKTYENPEDIVARTTATRTMLTEFFWMNQNSADAKRLKLLYKNFPQFFVWLSGKKVWKLRQRRVVVGRLVTASPSEGERYYLRVLLSNVPCPVSFDDLKTVNGQLFPTFREAALERGLLESDDDLQQCLEEASNYEMPYSLRRLFATLLLYNSPSDPRALWLKFAPSMSEDFARGGKLSLQEVQQKTLISIDNFLRNMGRSVDEFRLLDRSILDSSSDDFFSREYERERSIIVSEQDLLSIAMLNVDQRSAFDTIIAAVELGYGGAYFIDGPGGSGKTFLYRALLACIRSKGDVALAVATSGVAAGLLPGGRTAHSRFKFNLDVDLGASSNISVQTVAANLINSAKLILWDEASMAHRKNVEALDVLLRDIMKSKKIFGGKTIVFGGDFRPTMPVVVGGNKSDTIAASLVSSALWMHIQRIHLKENMRARNDPLFMEYLLRIGNGTEPCARENYVSIPSSMRLQFIDRETSLGELVQEVFPFLDSVNSGNSDSLLQRAILAPKNSCVDEINLELIKSFPGMIVEYVSFDITDNHKQQGDYEDFLHGVDEGGLPPHILRLKEGCPVILLRNLNPSEGLCNGTRLIVRNLGRRIVGAEIGQGDFRGNYVLIPRIPLEPSNKLKCPIAFKRHQFPIKLCFAMTINKAQGQTLEFVGIYLREPVFSHGQLYVALSRAKKGSCVKILIEPLSETEADCSLTRNVVFPEILLHTQD